MKHIPIVAGVLLGLLFIMSGAIVLFQLVKMPEMAKDTPSGAFMTALGPTGYLRFVKVLEILGGVLVMIPRTRNLGLLVLGPIIVNILAYHTFLTKGEGLFDPMLILICLLAVYLLWVGRKAWRGLVA